MERRLKFLTGLLTICTIFITIFAFNTFKAFAEVEITYETASASMVKGASVRVSGEDYAGNGIRFSMYMDEENYNALTCAATGENPTVKDLVFGMIIIPKAYANQFSDESAFKTEIQKVIDGNSDLYYIDETAVEGKTALWEVHDEKMNYLIADENSNLASGYYFHGVMTDIIEDNIDRQMIGVGYFGYTPTQEGSPKVRKLANFSEGKIENNTRSMVQVAYRAIQNEPEKAEWLQKNYIDKCEYTVSFNTDGGTPIASQTVKYGETLTKPENPVKANTDREEYTFDKWMIGDKEFDFNTKINNNGEITAVYTKVIKISTAAEFMEIQNTLDQDYTYVLANDIDLTVDSEGYTVTTKFSWGAGEHHDAAAVKEFKGHIKGNGHTVKMTISEGIYHTADTRYVFDMALIHKMSGGSIEDICFDMNFTNAYADQTALVMNNFGTVKNVLYKAKYAGLSDWGTCHNAMVWNNYGYVENCVAIHDVGSLTRNNAEGKSVNVVGAQQGLLGDLSTNGWAGMFNCVNIVVNNDSYQGGYDYVGANDYGTFNNAKYTYAGFVSSDFAFDSVNGWNGNWHKSANGILFGDYLIGERSDVFEDGLIIGG